MSANATLQSTAKVKMQEEYLRDLGIAYEKRGDGTLFVPGDINISGQGLTSLPDLSEVEVGGDFSCCNNPLTSLEGAPAIVGGNFWCQNSQLPSLKGAPAKVGGEFCCKNNPLTFLEGAPKVFSLLISDWGDFKSWEDVPEELRLSPETRKRPKNFTARAPENNSRLPEGTAAPEALSATGLRFNQRTDDHQTVEAYLWREEVDNYTRARFNLDHIAMRIEIAEKASRLKLADGSEIDVALPLDALDKKLYDRSIKDDDIIDLTKVTGTAVVSADLKEVFNAAVKKKKGCIVVLNGFNEKSRQAFKAMALSLEDLKTMEEDRTFKSPDKISFIKTHNDFYCFFYMNINDLRARLEQAKKNGEKILDLRGETKPREADEKIVSTRIEIKF